MSVMLTVPELGESDIEGTVVNIPVREGDVLEAGQTLLEVETDKVVVEVPATSVGTLEQLLIAVGDQVRAGSEFARLSAVASQPESSPAEPQLPVDAGLEKTADATRSVEPHESPVRNMDIGDGFQNKAEDIAAGPGVRRLARELGLDIGCVKGSGPRGRISRDDVKRSVRERISRPDCPAVAPAPRALPDFTDFGDHKAQPFSGIQKATAENMVHAASEIPHAWLQQKIDITELEQLRQQHKQSVREQGGGLTLTALLVKAVAQALLEFPVFNSCYDRENQQLLYRQYVDVGVAVDTDRGLVVPCVRGADGKSLTQISIDTTDIARKARERKLSARDLQGAGFTISNLGGMGVCGIFPIVNWPQVAILGVAASSEEPRLVAGQWQNRLMMPVTLGFDHRVINGADGARFLAAIKQTLQAPFSLAL
ncbi:2-oxo acid dehydrogenase subunit E2 [Pseudomaricurvus alkylphenolicus]|uniref:dihydrolipoamide acetyltransferase family protein n=1 Tax=Pseudomaricurvus alkylphenolicus TaxID=1306991 RepID=UPI0014208329|nr:dihydrolipoamide acetyltransferase family protein [Pseudomaricurvus alkylphenolicus]NIB42492.1 2-oxo acid dehydrogenase subunit E2 [Pseudomaricurvus alkylphenolicus]